ncbi:MAG: hypothetical protein LBI69_01825 [Puniceicoccales bacterium]|nr:hypothetical protein [Puniceicoccales bacterium]
MNGIGSSVEVLENRTEEIASPEKKPENENRSKFVMLNNAPGSNLSFLMKEDIKIIQGANEMNWGDNGVDGRKDFRNHFYDPSQGPSSSLGPDNFTFACIRWHACHAKNPPPSAVKGFNDLNTNRSGNIELDKSQVTFRLSTIKGNR